MAKIERYAYDSTGTKWVNIDTGAIISPPVDPDPPTDPRASFVVGTTVPTLTNTGVLPSVARTVDNRTTISNTSTVEVFRNKTFPNALQLVNAQNKSFENCMFEGRGSGSECVGGIDLGNRNLKFTDCTFSHPESLFPAGYLGTGGAKMGFRGHHVTLLRCQFTNVVDGFRPRYNLGNGLGDCNFEARGCFVDELLFLSPDGGQADRQSHNDCMQDDMVTGQNNVLIEGTWMRGYLNPNMGQAAYPLNPSNWTSTNGVTRIGGNTMYPLLLCTNVFQMKGTGGVGVKNNYRLINNWFFGGSTIINAGGVSSDQLKLTITGNRIGRDMRLGQTAFLNAPAAFVPVAFSGNTYYDNGAPANVRRNG